jgi:uncharacterized DUF497 family protein
LFSWDNEKNESNKAKHGIRFELAELVFEGPLHVSQQDRTENGELRWRRIYPHYFSAACHKN